MDSIKIWGFLFGFFYVSLAWSYEDFYMAVTADPQLTWACSEGSTCQRSATSVDAQGIVSNKWQAESINKLVEQYGSAFKGVIVNGDLTAYGHKNEFAQYKKYFRDLIKAPVFDGLGNHDYSNNIDDCFNNNCARRMVHYMYDKVAFHGSLTRNYDFKESHVYYKFPSLRQDFKGSLAYSYDIQGVHFIQLNFHPGYQRSFKYWNFKHATMEHYQITPAFAWLEKDLEQAYKDGKTIVVNLHDIGDHLAGADKERFKQLLEKYKVGGLFSGHIHSLVGPSNDGVNLPSFRSGSSPYNTFLLVHFENKKLREVSVIKSDYGNVSIQETHLY